MTGPAVASTNDIPTRQNISDNLNCQAAGKVFYRRAARLFYAQFGTGVLVPVGFAIANLVMPSVSPELAASRTSFAAWSALYGLIMLLLDELVLDAWQQTWKRNAAIAQEMFDTAVLCLPWRTTKVGPSLETADVYTLATSWQAVDASLTNVRDWYAPAVGRAPLHFARVICQRANLWWDSKLRERYAFGLGAFAVALAVIASALFKYLGLDVDGLLLATSTLAPAFRWALRERRRNLATVSTLDRVCKSARELYDATINDEIDVTTAEQRSRDLQDEIFDHRRSAPIGVPWVYRLLRPRYERTIQVDAERSVSEYWSRHEPPESRSIPQ